MAAAAPDSSPRQTPTPSDAELLDILYEILADGTGEEHGVSTETIEKFLHEHARSPRPAGALAAFFAEHGLSKDPADYGCDPALAAVPSGLHRAEPDALAEPAQAWVGGADESGSQVRPAAVLDSEPAPSAMPHVVRDDAAPSRPAWLLPLVASLAVLACAAGVLAAVTAVQERDLERELNVSKLQLESTGMAVDSLRQQAAHLDEELALQREKERALQDRLDALLAAEQARVEAEADKRTGRPRGR